MEKHLGLEYPVEKRKQFPIDKICECGRTYRQYNTLQNKCPHCTYLEATGKKKAKVSREKKQRAKPVPWREKPTDKMIQHVQTKIVNPYIRERDQTNFGISISDNGPISDAGHYYSVGSKQGLRFSPQNIHGQSRSGNSHLFKGGDLINYRHGLVRRFGENYVKELDHLAMLSEGRKSLDRHNVILIGETYLYLRKHKIWVFTQKEFDQIKLKIHEQKGCKKRNKQYENR